MFILKTPGRDFDQTENNRRARYYKLTPAGRKRLKQEAAKFERARGAIVRPAQPA